LPLYRLILATEAACLWRPPLSRDFTNRDGTSI
jgi:hypothetical protein